MRIIYMLPDKHPTKRKDMHGRSWHEATQKAFLEEFDKNWGMEKVIGYFQNHALALYIIKEYVKVGK